ncbi:endo-1,6-alpha-mannosidase [Gloeophyllum trabeum ATCC 11539]|uniref:Endo-1,6-alpha-mannosidase n=1 Tax=Gloeophyllum trabeum (strain ATCC 11539 / FP-39264 / Madison 617) TaxID=670483 RepID=S7RU49_GLOTA|nr:endo-1,6-alpha-mannosidase [Gloeophyllum trabeum ATCC 11539]EPQ56699.1 endo-1,6-alpha-mannosidase [Gloeophyllum trabeum ATCC 11539]
MLRRSLFFLGLCGLSLAQDLSVPSSWREPTNSRSSSDRVTIAQNAINVILGQLDSSDAQFNGIGWWQSGNVWSVLANQDHITSTTTNKNNVVNALNTGWSLFANYDQYHTTTTHCGGPQPRTTRTGLTETPICCNMLLIRGTTSQYYTDDVGNSQITDAEASSGSIPGKSFSIEGSCNGATMSGGVFWRPTSDDQGINSITTGLGAYLADATGDSKYANAASAAATWIRSHNINSDNIVLDTVNGHDCSTSPSSWLFTYNSGKYIEGLSVLADVTGDSSWRDLAVNIIAAATHTSAWQGSNGVITEGASPDSNNDGVGFKAVFIRGLHEAWTRSASNTDLRNLIRAYIDVQYNALLELAANGDSYSSSWTGPPQSFTTWGQLAALDVLTAAIDVNN